MPQNVPGIHTGFQAHGPPDTQAPVRPFTLAVDSVMAVAHSLTDIGSRRFLTDRERACLRLLADGEADGAIAARLGIAKQVLRAKNRVHMIALALRANMLDP